MDELGRGEHAASRAVMTGPDRWTKAKDKSRRLVRDFWVERGHVGLGPKQRGLAGRGLVVTKGARPSLAGAG